MNVMKTMAVEGGEVRVRRAKRLIKAATRYAGRCLEGREEKGRGEEKGKGGGKGRKRGENERKRHKNDAKMTQKHVKMM